MQCAVVSVGVTVMLQVGQPDSAAHSNVGLCPATALRPEGDHHRRQTGLMLCKNPLMPYWVSGSSV